MNNNDFQEFIKNSEFHNLNGKKLIFVDIDTQKDFMNKDGKLYVPYAENIKANLKKLTEYALNNDIPILATLDKHFPDDEEFNVFPQHCLYGSEGMEKIPETLSNKVRKNSIRLFEKSTYDVFDSGITKGNHVFQDIINGNDITEAVVYGVATDYCVKAAVLGLLKRGIKVTVVIDAIKGVDEKTTTEAINEMGKSGAIFTGTECIINV